MAEWVQQQPWQICGISAPRPRASLAKANKHEHAPEVERDPLRHDKVRLSAKVKTLEREAAQRARAPGRRGRWRARRPRRGGGGAAGTRFLSAGAQVWHVPAEAALGHMSVIAMSLRMAVPQSQEAVEAATVARDAAKVATTHDQLVHQYPPPAAVRRWIPPAGRRSRAPRAPLAGALLKGGGMT